MSVRCLKFIGKFSFFFGVFLFSVVVFFFFGTKPPIVIHTLVVFSDVSIPSCFNNVLCDLAIFF